MGVAYHSAYAPDGVGLNLFDRVDLGVISVTYASSGAGAAVTTAVTWTEPVITPYCAIASMVEDATYYVTSRTTISCSLVITPRLAANSLSGGTVQLFLIS